MNVAQTLAGAQQLGLSRLDATLLLAHHMQRRREWLIAHPGADVSAAELAAFGADCQRRIDSVPLAYLTGHREFMGLELGVTHDVLVPRPETETLVEWAIERLRAMPETPAPRVVDLGTGSGAVALALAAACPPAQVTGTDCSPAALAVAQANAQRLGLNVHFANGDWWSAVGSARFELAVANPPYIAAGDVHLAALRHEPQHALLAGVAGLDALRRIIEGAPGHLSGWLLLEHGWQQADDVMHLLAETGFIDVESRRDLSGLPRCTGGRIQ
jgi:release factor glutamine methyltransferase